MLKYVFIILLINTYNCGWSISLHLKSNGKTETNNTLAGSFHFLANNCDHNFISHEIQNKFADCSLPSLEYNKYLKCLIFYDINQQLCNSSIDLRNEKFNTQVNEKLDVIEFCAGTTSWPVTDLEIDPHYSKKFKRIFSNSHLCTRFCESQDIFIEDVDFYCKYYKWGLDVLTKAISHNAQNIQSENILSVDSGSFHSIKSNIDANSLNNNLTPTTVKEQANDLKTDPLEMSLHQETVVEPNAEIVNDVKSEQFINEVQLGPDVAVAQQFGITSAEQVPLKQDFTYSITEEIKKTDALDQLDDTNNFTKLSIVTHKDSLYGNLPKVHPKLQVVNNQANSVDNGQVSEEDPGNALQDLDMMDDTNFDENSDLGFSKDSVKITIPEREPNLRELYTNMIQESFTEDEDDHFFSLFLTGVVFVILLYVLYCHKNKVSKVVIGLVGKRASHHALPTKMRY